MKTNESELPFGDTVAVQWERLSPKRAQPLKAGSLWTQLTTDQSFLTVPFIAALPHHDFFDENTLLLHFTAVIDECSALDNKSLLEVRWFAANRLYRLSPAEKRMVYKIDLLVFKRRVYEQGASLADKLEVHYERDLGKIMAEAGGGGETLDRLIEKDLRASSELRITKTPGKKVKTLGFNRYNDVSWQNKGSTSGATQVRIELGEYWHLWLPTALEAALDFDYLETLAPLEMRFYELTKLLRINNDKSKIEIKEEEKISRTRLLPLGGTFTRNTISITYDDFASLMPLERREEYSAIREQLQNLTAKHRADGYLKKMEIGSAPPPEMEKGSGAIISLEF